MNSVTASARPRNCPTRRAKGESTFRHPQDERLAPLRRQRTATAVINVEALRQKVRAAPASNKVARVTETAMVIRTLIVHEVDVVVAEVAVEAVAATARANGVRVADQIAEATAAPSAAPKKSTPN
jgi:hypothetical protein